VGGIQPLTTIDFPGRLACVLFLKGCNLRCSYCHNPEFLEATGPTEYTWDQVGAFLERRKTFLDGVVLSGGEPTVHCNLEDAITRIRTMGFEIALHTNGCFPDRLETLIKGKLLDYVALDIKAPFGEYGLVTSIGDGKGVAESIRLLSESGVSYEVRTTVHPDLLSDGNIMQIASTLKKYRVPRFFLQMFKHGRIFDPGLSHPSSAYLKPSTLDQLRQDFPEFSVREN
jgi:pyruvate formate lyase activating enzyme